MKKDFIPLSDVNHGSEAREGTGVTFGLTLPDYAPAEAILVNVSRIGRIARLGGLEGVTVSNYSGETTTLTPDVDGVDDHGTATASGKSTIKKAETERSLLTSNNGADIAHGAYRWSQARVELNQEELEDSILRDKASVRDPKQWSSRIDKSLRKGLRAASHEELGHWANMFTFVGISVLGTAGDGFIFQKGLGLDQSFKQLGLAYGAGFIFAHMGAQMIDSYSSQQKGYSFKNRRKSIFQGLQLDRLVAVELLTRKPRIVKAA